MITYRFNSGSAAPATNASSSSAPKPKLGGRMNYGRNDPSASLPSNEEKSAKSSSKLDFRFADSEDAGDVVRLVNEAYSHALTEFEKNSEDEATPKIDHDIDKDKEKNSEEGATVRVVSIVDVEEDLDTSTNSKNWLLIESPQPEELLVGACRMILNLEKSEEEKKVSCKKI